MDFESVLEDVKNNTFSSIVILGDLNADFQTPQGRNLLNFCNMQNLTHLISEPTRITNTTSTVLDQIITTVPNFVNTTSVSPPVSSNDYCTVGFHMNFKLTRNMHIKDLFGYISKQTLTSLDMN